MAADAGLAGVKSDNNSSDAAEQRWRADAIAVSGSDWSTCTYAGNRSKVWSGKGGKTKAEHDACSKTGNSPRVPPVF